MGLKIPEIKPAEAKAEEPEKKEGIKINRKSLNTGEFDLFAHMAKVSEKNKEHEKPGFVPSPEKPTLTIEEIEARDAKEKEK